MGKLIPDDYFIDIICPCCNKKIYVVMKIGGTGYSLPVKATKKKPKEKTEYEEYT